MDNIYTQIRKFVINADYRFLALSNLGFYNWMSDEDFIKKKFKIKLGYDLNLDNPQTFNEKLQWLKIHDRKPIYTTMVDKYAVKRYVANSIGEKYVIPTYGVWGKFDDIDFDSLPNQFVLKCTSDSGGVVICKDKSTFDKKEAKKKLNKHLRGDYYWVGREWPYKNVKPQIIAEKYMVDESGYEFRDYKIWCFNGEPIYVQYITNRSIGKPLEAFYNSDWEKEPFTFYNSPLLTSKEKPSCLTELLSLARTLSKGIKFVRVDFYILADGSIRFGEITFYPMSGMCEFHPQEMDIQLGHLLDIDKSLKEDLIV